MSFEIFTPIWSRIEENEKKKSLKKSKNQNFEKKNILEIWLTGVPPKYGVNSLKSF